MAKINNWPANFNIEECKLKHELINKDIDSINDKITTFYQEINERQKHLKEEMEQLGKYLEDKFSENIESANESLKNKIILTEKSMGEKIDVLDEFSEQLKGNGEPGIREQIRLINLKMKAGFLAIGVFCLILLGGEFWGVNRQTIKDFFYPSKQEKTKEILNEVHDDIHKVYPDKLDPDPVNPPSSNTDSPNSVSTP